MSGRPRAILIPTRSSMPLTHMHAAWRFARHSHTTHTGALLTTTPPAAPSAKPPPPHTQVNLPG
mgnify:CR=1 FL=1